MPRMTTGPRTATSTPSCVTPGNGRRRAATWPLKWGRPMRSRPTRGGGGIRTLTGDGLSALPLPVGLRPLVTILDPGRPRHEDGPVAHDLGDVDLTDLDAFADGFPHDIFRLHRDQAPVWWHEPTVHTPDGEGFWSVATYDEVLQVLRDAATYSSETGGDRPYGGTILQGLPVAGIVLNMM